VSRSIYLRTSSGSGHGMPFKSRAQRRKFAELLVKGKISPQTFEEWNRETGSAMLPEHVRKSSERAKPKRTKKKTAAKASKRTVKRKGRS
jgi:hypothetical protein